MNNIADWQLEWIKNNSHYRKCREFLEVIGKEDQLSKEEYYEKMETAIRIIPEEAYPVEEE